MNEQQLRASHSVRFPQPAVAPPGAEATRLADQLELPELTPSLFEVSRSARGREALQAFELLLEEATPRAAAKTRLAHLLRGALAEEETTEAVCGALVLALWQELSIDPRAARSWYPSFPAATEVLGASAFPALRQLNREAAPLARVRLGIDLWETEAVLKDITRSALEGRFGDWHGTNPASQKQLAMLGAAPRADWLALAPPRTRLLTGTQRVREFTTSEVRGLSLFSACARLAEPHQAVALLANVRNRLLIAQESTSGSEAAGPPAVQALLRLCGRAEDRAPALLLSLLDPLSSQEELVVPESLAVCALIEHARVRALELELPLALDASLGSAIRELELQGCWKRASWLLAPALLIENGSEFGKGPWRQQSEEVVTTPYPTYLLS